MGAFVLAAVSYAPCSSAQLQSAPPADERRTAAERTLSEGLALQAEGTAAANARAVERLAQSAELWRELAEARLEAEALESLGVLLTSQDVPRAREVLTRALSLAGEAGDEARKASVLVSLGSLHLLIRETRLARERLDAALPLARALGNVDLEARALAEIGACLRHQAEPAQARETVEEALRLARLRENHVEEARSLSTLGLIHVDAGEMQQAFDVLRRAVALHREAGDRTGEAVTLNNLGYAHETAGDYPRALENYEQALARLRGAGDRSREGRTLNLIGWIHALGFDDGDDAKGLAYLREAARIQRQTGDTGGLAYTLIATSELLRQQHDLPGARAAAEEALDLVRQSGATLTVNRLTWLLAAIHADEGSDEEARALFGAALDGYRSAGNHHNVGDVLCDIAAFLRDRGQLQEARARIEEAIRLLEKERSSVASDDLRSTYLESHRYYYDLHLDILMALHERQPGQGLDALALATSERARARGLLETLARARLGIAEGVDPALLEAERDRRSRLSAKEQERVELLAADERGERLAVVERELQTALGEYHDIQERLQVASPTYAAMTPPEPLGLPGIQREVLDEETLLLEYALGEKRSFLWAVTRDAMRSHVLPGSKTIDAAARRAHETFAQSHRRAFRGQAAVAARELSRMVLGPVADLLGDRRLVIVAEGALAYVPMGALPHPSGPTGSAPLIVSREVVMLPSASSLAILRRDLAGRASAPLQVAVLSDPVFRKDDPRVRSNVMRSPSASAPADTLDPEVTRAAAAAGVGALERLRFSRREAEAIAALAPPGAALKALDFAASRATATSRAMRDYRIVHFATHGLLNSRHPELSGIVLSLVDEHGEPQDGFLRLNDLYNLKLGADLVVLSACQTALGKQVKGEGLVGLTRGFFYAGAPRVIASLWSVRDEATAALMTRLYRTLLRDGQSPAAALRAAQVSLRKDPRWRAPYYWAGFVLQGEWQPRAESRATLAHSR
jgi:CHAT domain-containing protein/tetratricopeptide (TPR) repeat protein